MTRGQNETLPSTYRAWVWRTGSEPRGLRLEERPLQEPAPGEVLARNHVIGFNPVDWKVLGGELMQWHRGHVPGVDGAGIVAVVGDSVETGWLGTRVAYHQSLHRHGSFAEFVPIKAEALLRLPQTLDFAAAASFPCPALTAWLALDKLLTRPGEWLLISGAGGAVGHYLVQLAVAQSWTVAVRCHPRHWDRLRALGAAECLAGPLPADQDWPCEQAERYQAVIDSVGPDHAARLTPALKANGHLVCIQGRVEHWPTHPSAAHCHCVRWRLAPCISMGMTPIGQASPGSPRECSPPLLKTAVNRRRKLSAPSIGFPNCSTRSSTGSCRESH